MRNEKGQVEEQLFMTSTYIASSLSKYQKEKKPPTIRERYSCEGGKFCRRGAIIGDKWHIKQQGATRARILFRYYTLNGRFRNYSARVKLLDGPKAGKVISVRM